MRIKERGGTHKPRLHFLLMGHCGTINRSGFVQNGLSGKWSGSLASTSTSLIERKHWPNEELGTHSIVFPRLLTCFVFISRLSRVQYLQPLHSSIPETRARSWTRTHIHKYKHTHMRALFHNLFPQRENTRSYTTLPADFIPQNIFPRSQNFTICATIWITIKNIPISSSLLAELILYIRSIKIVALHDTLNQEKFEEISGQINDVSNLHLSQKRSLPALAPVGINQLSINIHRCEALQRTMAAITHEMRKKD